MKNAPFCGLVLTRQTLFVNHSAVLLVGMATTMLWMSANCGHGSEGAEDSVACLQLVDSEGQPAVAAVYLGQVGYSADIAQLPTWASNQERLVELKGLPTGKHTLVANPVGPNPTIFEIELPSAAEPIRQRLEPSPEWRAGGRTETLETRTSVAMRDKQAIIELELTNKTDDPIRLPKLTMTNMDLRIFIPEQLQQGVVVIKPHNTQLMTLDWTRIVNEGVWLYRTEPLSEPWPANEPGEGLQYFRLNIGVKGLLPVALPKPSLVRKRSGATKSDRPLLKREFPLGNFGGIPQRGVKPAPLPQGLDPGQDESKWFDAEYYLQYRVRIERHDANGKATNAAMPLLYLDLRNQGDFDLGIETHQSQQRLVVDDVEYERRDQPWGGIDSIAPGSQPVSLPFLLSPDWRTNADDEATGLNLAVGQHSVRVKLHLFEFYEGESGRRRIQPKGSRNLTTRQVQVQLERRPKDMDTTTIAIENMRRELAVFPRFHAPKVTQNLERLIRENQPAAGDYLLSVLGQGNDSAPDPASCVVAQMWDTFSRSQIERYLKASMSHFVGQRQTYPQGVDVGIAVGPRFNPGYSGLPREVSNKVTSKTTTKHYLDDQQVGKPLKYDLHTTISHWFRTGDLAAGRHEFRLVTDYEFHRGGEAYVGRIESPAYEFEIVADTTDALLAPKDAALDEQVREAIRIDEVRSTSTWGRKGWQPQMRWGDSERFKGGSLHTPVWEVQEPLPVDLCFETEFRIEGADVSVQGNELVVFAGEARSFYFRLASLESISILRKHADKDGYVKVRVVLTPSQAIALTHPPVKRYFGGAIISDIVRFRVDRDEIGDLEDQNPYWKADS